MSTCLWRWVPWVFSIVLGRGAWFISFYLLSNKENTFCHSWGLGWFRLFLNILLYHDDQFLRIIWFTIRQRIYILFGQGDLELFQDLIFYINPKHTIQSLPIRQLSLQTARRNIVMQLNKLRIMMCDNLSHQNYIYTVVPELIFNYLHPRSLEPCCALVGRGEFSPPIDTTLRAIFILGLVRTFL